LLAAQKTAYCDIDIQCALLNSEPSSDFFSKLLDRTKKTEDEKNHKNIPNIRVHDFYTISSLSNASKFENLALIFFLQLCFFTNVN